MNSLSLPSHRQRGLATVEMAFVTPVLLVLLLVTFEFTRAFYQTNTLTKSVRDSARLLSLNGFKGSIFNISAGDISDAKNLAVYGNLAGTGSPVLENLSTADFDVDWNNLNITSGGVDLEHVRVSVSYDFQPLWPVIRNMGFLSSDVNTSALTLTAESTMRALQ